MFIILLFYSFLMTLSSGKFVRNAQTASLNRITDYEGFESEIMGQTSLISFSGIMRYWPKALYLTSWVSIR